MTGPAREDRPEEVPTLPPGLDDPAPEPTQPKRDAWDDEEGVPVDVEDIAIVCHEALRAYRSAMGGRPGFAWMHLTTSERKAWAERVQNLLDDQIEPTDDNPESRLVAAIVGTLKP